MQLIECRRPQQLHGLRVGPEEQAHDPHFECAAVVFAQCEHVRDKLLVLALDVLKNKAAFIKGSQSVHCHRE